MSDVIEWDADGAGSYGVVTCPGPFLGGFCKGTIIASDDEGGTKTIIFRISLFSLSSGGWVPFIDSYKGFPDAQDIFERLSRRSCRLMKEDAFERLSKRFIGEPA